VNGDAAAEADAQPLARIALRKEPAPARARAPVFHVFAEMYARSRSGEPRAPAVQVPSNGGCS
jgi:hypothetical protein